jgi:hypothetical protein
VIIIKTRRFELVFFCKKNDNYIQTIKFDFSNEKIKSYEPCFWKAFLFFMRGHSTDPHNDVKSVTRIPKTTKISQKMTLVSTKHDQSPLKIVNYE